MSLLDYYHSCYAADWNYEYAESETYRRGRAQVEQLRDQTRDNSARLCIFDACRRAGLAGKPMPHFGDIASYSCDRAFLIEAIANHDKEAQHYWSKATRALERGLSADADATLKYHFHNALLTRLREQQARLKDAAA